MRSLLIIHLVKSAAAAFTTTYTLHGKDIDSTKCIINRIRPAPRDENAQKDEIEMLYPTTHQAFKAPNSVDYADKMLNIRQTDFSCGQLGATVWPSAIALAALLANDDATKKLIKGKRVMELGSGCGLPSLVAKEICGAHSVCATDYWEVPTAGADGNIVLPIDTPSGDSDRLVPKDFFGANLAYNIGSSFINDGNVDTDDGGVGEATAMVQRLDWHDEMSISKLANTFRHDLIIGSDLVYYPMDTAPLLQTLEILLKSGGGNKDALLISPLPPQAVREALPDFRKRLEEDGELGDDCEVIVDELKMVGNSRRDEIYRLLRVQIHSARSS